MQFNWCKCHCRGTLSSRLVFLNVLVMYVIIKNSILLLEFQCSQSPVLQPGRSLRVRHYRRRSDRSSELFDAFRSTSGHWPKSRVGYFRERLRHSRRDCNTRLRARCRHCNWTCSCPRKTNRQFSEKVFNLQSRNWERTLGVRGRGGVPESVRSRDPLCHQAETGGRCNRSVCRLLFG